jgi:DNA-binding NtrC family response regulator
MSERRPQVLVIDDEKSVCLTCSRILELDGLAVEYATSGIAGLERAVREGFDVVLLDLKMPDMHWLEALSQIKRARKETCVIIITGYATIQTSIQAIKHGAFNYVPKPFTPEELSVAVSKAIADRRMRQENEYLKKELVRAQHERKILGRAPSSEQLKMQILMIAPTNLTVTIYGESGTGKELIAQAIHQASKHCMHTLPPHRPHCAIRTGPPDRDRRSPPGAPRTRCRRSTP